MFLILIYLSKPTISNFLETNSSQSSALENMLRLHVERAKQKLEVLGRDEAETLLLGFVHYVGSERVR